MSSFLGIDGLEDKASEQDTKEAPKKWRKRGVADWYFALKEIKSAMLKAIASDPEAFTEEGCKITNTDISEKMGKNKSHLSPSQWRKKDTPAKKVKAFLVEEIDKINDSLRLARAYALDGQAGDTKSTARSKAALLRDIEDRDAAFKTAEQQAWGNLLQQLDHTGEELQSKCRDLEEAFEKAQESIRNQRQVHQKNLSERSLDRTEADRLTQLNEALSADLREAQEKIDQLSSTAHTSKGELVSLELGEANISSPPECINSAAWAEWIEYRAEKGKKVSSTAARKQWRRLGKLSLEEQARIIDKSIANDYQGLFLPKSTGGQETRGRSIAQDLTDTSWAE